MPLSYSFKKPGDPLAGPRDEQDERRRVLVTGANGRIGAYFAEHAFGKYALRLQVREPEKGAAISKWGEVVVCPMSDLEGLKRICQDVDTVVHLAGDPSPEAVWSSLLESNIVGTYNLMVAAKSAGVRRVIYASSIHAVSGYPNDVQVKSGDPVNPGDLYGVSKCFGESLGRYMAEQEGLSVVAIRIGAFQPVKQAEGPKALWMMDCFLAHPDLQDLLERCIDDTRLRFAIFQAVSDNRFKRLDISDARELVGYAPQHDLTEVYPELKKLNLDETVLGHNVRDPKSKSGLREDL
jgi:hypothetical protein